MKKKTFDKDEAYLLLRALDYCLNPERDMIDLREPHPEAQWRAVQAKVLAMSKEEQEPQALAPVHGLSNALNGAFGESPDEWYEREKAAFIAWWESEGQKKFGETPTLAAGAGWLARAAFSVDQSSTDTPARKKLGFAAAVREYGDNWRQEGFGWNGESYRGLSPATMIALSGDDGPDRADYYQMKRCAKHGRMFQL